MWFQEKENTIYDALKPLIIVSKFLGLLPLDIESKKSKKLQLCFNLFWLTLTITLLVLSMKNASSVGSKPRDQDEKTIFLKNILTFIVIISEFLNSIIVIFILGIKQSSELIKIIDKIATIDNNLQQFRLNLNYGRTKLVILGYITLFLVAFLVLYKGMLRGAIQQNVLLFLYLYLFISKSLFNVAMALFLTFLLLIRKKLQIVNFMLKKMSLRNDESLFSDFVTICDVHQQLVALAQHLNRIYSPVLLFLFTISMTGFFQTTLEIYITFIRNQGLIVMDLVLWIIYYVFMAFALTAIPEAVHKEAKNTASLFHDVNPRNVKLKRLINMKSLQLYHNKLSFTILEFIPLDVTMAGAMFSGVITIIIIVIQFVY